MLIKHTLKRVFNLLPASYRKRSIGILLLIIVSSLLDLLGLGVLIPLMTVIIKDDLLENEILDSIYTFFNLKTEFDLILLVCISVLIVILVKNVMAVFISRAQAKFSHELSRDIGVECLDKRYERGVDSLSEQSSNDIMWQVNSLPNIFVTTLLMPLLSLFNEFLILLFIFISILILDFKILVILSIVILPGILILYNSIKNKITANTKEVADLTPVVNAKTQQLIFGFLDVKISTKYTFFKDQFYRLKDRMKQLRVINHVYNQITPRLLETLIITGAVTLILYGKFTELGSEYLVSIFGMFAIASYKLVPSVNKLSSALLSIKSNQFTLNYIEEALAPVERPKNQTTICEFQDLELTDFCFGYSPDSMVLKNLSLKINKGDKIGLIGKSGGGKTTLMNCLLGFFSNYTGNLKLNGTELTHINHDSWLSQIGYVKQNVFLLDGTIKENITFGLPNEDINKVQLDEAVKKSSLKEFISTLPDGLDTKTGELGSSLSGGQRQRIGIARALYFGAKVLFFDEATSALDNETESEIVETLDNLSRETNITMIIIAHRHSTLKHCQRIYELTDGIISRELTYKDI